MNQTVRVTCLGVAVAALDLAAPKPPRKKPEAPQKVAATAAPLAPFSVVEDSIPQMTAALDQGRVTLNFVEKTD
jgi:hypothetical protein